MPILEAPPYSPPFHLRQKDLHTIIPARTRRVKVSYNRFRLELPDGDFLDLDFSAANTDFAAPNSDFSAPRPGKKRPIFITTHGLEGNSGSRYIKGITRAVNEAGFDSVALNLRGCSGEPNRLYISYHSGKTDDLDHVVNHLIDDLGYREIILNGFSLGGNLSIKYAGERGDSIRPEIKGLVAASVPCDLEATCANLQRRRNWVYLKNFMITLKKKAIMKQQSFPEEATYTLAEARAVRNFIDYDNLYTAPAHGFKDAPDYYQSCSSNRFISGLTIPTLLINAVDDPFLTPECFPFAQAKDHPLFHFMAPQKGGHVGFTEHWRQKGNTWLEDRVVEFLERFRGKF